MLLIEPNAPSALPVAPAAAERVYRVGSLAYTRSMRFRVFVRMLWGDLCLNVMESAIPRLVPLQLQQLGASNAAVGVLTGRLSSLLNWPGEKRRAINRLPRTESIRALVRR